MRRVRILVVLCAWMLSCASDPAPLAATQVLLRLYAPDVQLIGQSSHLRITLFRQDAENDWVQRSFLLLSKERLQWPVDIPITPSSDDAALKPFEVVVEVMNGDSVRAETRAVARFVPREWRVLELWLFQCPQDDGRFVCAEAGCHGAECEVCEASGTCTATGERGSEQLLPFDPELPPASGPQPDAAFTAESDVGSTAGSDAGTPGPADAESPAPDAEPEPGRSASGTHADAGDAMPPPEQSQDAESLPAEGSGAPDACDDDPCGDPAFNTCERGAEGAPVCTLGGTSGTLRRGPEPTPASTTERGPYGVQSYSTGFRDGPSFSGAEIHYPEDATPPLAFVAIVPGFSQTRATMLDWAVFIASHGIVAMAVDSNAAGDQPATRAAALRDALQSLAAEDGRTGSPLQGLLATDRRGVMGYSMGGGGALIAASQDPSLSAAVSLSGWGSAADFSDVRVPSLILGGDSDEVNTDPQSLYGALPTDTPRMLYEVRGGDAGVTLSPSEVNGAVGGRALAWLKLHLEGDDRYLPLLMERPPDASWFLSDP